MAIQLKNTSDVNTSGIKALVYGVAGAGKTTLASTLPRPLIISAEAGLLSLQGRDIPYIEISTLPELMDAYSYITSKDGDAYQSIVLDSISEIGEVVLNHEKATNKDGRAAYGEMAVQMTAMIRAFRDLAGKHVLFTAKAEKSTDETGRVLYAPSMPGNKVAQSLPYFFDLVMPLRVEKDAEGVAHRGLMCHPDGLWAAKDRSGKLDAWEPCDMSAIIAKIGGVQ